MDDLQEKVRHFALLRIARIFKVPPESLVPQSRFGEQLKASFVSDFRTNEYEQVDRDIKDVADRKMLKEFGAGALEIKTVGDYCDHMVRCYHTKPKQVMKLLGMDA